MDDQDLNQRLSRITTLWTMVLQAKEGPEGADAEAQARLMRRYGGAVYRYLLGAVRDPDVADDLAQEFALRFLRGDFRRVDPQRGRFRNFVKTAVINLVNDYRRRQKTRPQPLSPEGPEPAAPPAAGVEVDQGFLDSWRNELLTRAWEALERAQEQTNQPLYAALRLRADEPDLDTTELAERLSAQLGKPVTANWMRQLLYRARREFADFLLDDVLQSLDHPTAEQLGDELRALGLYEYCRPALERRDQAG